MCMLVFYFISVFQKTPDNDFIIDKHPKHSNIIIGVGFTGMYSIIIMQIICLTSLIVMVFLPQVMDTS